MTEMDRRTFLVTGTAVAGGGALFGASLAKADAPNAFDLSEGDVGLTHFIRISRDNSVSVAVPRAEMGQGVHTALAALVAEELELDWRDIDIFHPQPDPAYTNIEATKDGLPVVPHDTSWAADVTRRVGGFFSKFVSVQMTGSSSSVRDAWLPMRLAGAAAREMLKVEAAERWNVEPAMLTIRDRSVWNGAEHFSFGELAAAAAERRVPEDVPLKSPDEWRLIGQSLPRPDVPPKVSGTAIYGIDVDEPGQLYAALVQNPDIGGGVLGVDDAQARASAGYVATVVLESGVAVISESFWQAKKAVDLLEVVWSSTAHPRSSREVYEGYERLIASGEEGDVFRDDGEVSKALRHAATRMDATYRTPYLAHTCMEPMNCTVRVDEDGAEIWMGAQTPGSLVTQVADRLGKDPEKVKLNVTYLGGGFGRRLEVDVALQAADIAAVVPGRPVKLIWTREEDVTHDFYRPSSQVELTCGADQDGRITALSARAASQSVLGQWGPRVLGSTPPTDVTTVLGLFDQPYQPENYHVAHLADPSSFPVGHWRSIGHSHGAFVMESFLDEVAVQLGRDPADIRREMLNHSPGALQVLEAVLSLSGWGAALPERWGQGLAMQHCFGSNIAQVVHVSLTPDEEVKVEKVFTAADVGPVVNPAIVRSQIESGIIYGLSAALMQEITIEEGAVQQSNFHDYDALRMNQTPQMETTLLQIQESVGGVGEIGTPAVGPALTNAIFDATGTRLRDLPVSKEFDIYF